tara:strand:+ start:457 stop:699 length:243 start_codon:yes stop_codon:yes gene_type:complete
MAEWKHKERNFKQYSHENPSGVSVSVVDWSNGEYPSATRNSNFKSFPEWLDWQCSDGWEVFKISRNFQSGDTWCIFRRLV